MDQQEEGQALRCALKVFLARLLREQCDLPEDAARLLRAHLWDLLDADPPKGLAA